MSIQYVLSPNQSPTDLLAWQANDPQHFFVLKKSAGLNVLLVNTDEQHFQAPLEYQAVQVGQKLNGTFVHQIDFKYTHDNIDTIAHLLGDNALLVNDPQGKASGVLWTFWPNETGLNQYLSSENYANLQGLMQDTYTSLYQHVTNIDQL